MRARISFILNLTATDVVKDDDNHRLQVLRLKTPLMSELPLRLGLHAIRHKTKRLPVAILSERCSLMASEFVGIAFAVQY
jgi:hypothetical protein